MAVIAGMDLTDMTVWMAQVRIAVFHNAVFVIARKNAKIQIIVPHLHTNQTDGGVSDIVVVPIRKEAASKVTRAILFRVFKHLPKFLKTYF